MALAVAEPTVNVIFKDIELFASTSIGTGKLTLNVSLYAVKLSLGKEMIRVLDTPFCVIPIQNSVASQLASAIAHKEAPVMTNRLPVGNVYIVLDPVAALATDLMIAFL